MIDRNRGHHHVERVAQPDALPHHVERAASREARLDSQQAAVAAHLRLFQIGEIALRALAAVHVAPAFLRENLLGEHALQRAELNVQLHRRRALRQRRQKKYHRPHHSCFSSCSRMVPMVNVIRTRICTGSLRRSSDTHRFRCAGRL